MNTATAKSMNLHLQKSDIRISVKVPMQMKDLIKRMADEKNITESAYVKLAVNNQLIRDLSETE